ncbi:MAG: ubiquitin family protein [Leptospirales bacterium]
MKTDPIMGGPDRTLTVINHQTGTTREIRPVKTVQALLRHLELTPETVLVIQGEALLCDDDPLDQNSPVEIRPVISGGSLP